MCHVLTDCVREIQEYFRTAPFMGKLRIHAAIPDMPDNLHDQGIAVLDPNIFRDLEPFSIEEFSGAMRFSANIIKNRKKLEKCP